MREDFECQRTKNALRSRAVCRGRGLRWLERDDAASESSSPPAPNIPTGSTKLWSAPTGTRRTRWFRSLAPVCGAFLCMPERKIPACYPIISSRWYLRVPAVGLVLVAGKRWGIHSRRRPERHGQRGKARKKTSRRNRSSARSCRLCDEDQRRHNWKFHGYKYDISIQQVTCDHWTSSPRPFGFALVLFGRTPGR